MADGCQCATCRTIRELRAELDTARKEHALTLRQATEDRVAEVARIRAELTTAERRSGELAAELQRVGMLDANVQRTRAAALTEAAEHLRKQALGYPSGTTGMGLALVLAAVDKMLSDLQGPIHA